MNQFLKSTKLLTDIEADNEFLDNIDPLLKNSYCATTNDITVTIWSEFMDSKSSVIGDLFIWAYHVRIDNNSDKKIKLINRYWRVIDENGIEQEFSGEGVIGEQPLIIPGDSYQYSSGIHLNCPSGIMNGKYQVKYDDGDFLDVEVPSFSLDVPSVKSIVN